MYGLFVLFFLEKKTNYFHRDGHFSEIYSLCCSRRNLIKMRTKAKTQLVSNMDRIFPELSDFKKQPAHQHFLYIDQGISLAKIY